MDTTAQSLAPPSDLEPGAVRAITEVLKPLIADAFAYYLKTKNFHWHMSGAQQPERWRAEARRGSYKLESFVRPTQRRYRHVGE